MYTRSHPLKTEMIAVLTLIVLLVFTISIVLSSRKVEAISIDTKYRTVVSPWAGDTLFTLAPKESVYMDLTGIDNLTNIVVHPPEANVESIILSSKWIERNSTTATPVAYNVTILDRDSNVTTFSVEGPSGSGGILLTNHHDTPVTIRSIEQFID